PPSSTLLPYTTLFRSSRELTYDFLRLHQPFIYPRSSTPDLLDEIAKIKHRIERDIVGSEKLERDVKLGRGGIRDIEFIVQTLQRSEEHTSELQSRSDL